MKTKSFLIAVATLLATQLLVSCNSKPDQENVGYWVWRSSDLGLVDSQVPLLLYQGDFHSKVEDPLFVKRGVAPFQFPKRREIGILIRLYEIEDAKALVDQVIYVVREWQRHQIEVTEIQLDYDSPSSRLLEYKHFIDQTRAQLDRENMDVPLSITGLVTWLNDDPQSLSLLAESVTYIAFQLYDTHDPIADFDAYTNSLKHFDYPYKIGISTSDKFNGMEYPKNENHRGVLVFLNVSQ